VSELRKNPVSGHWVVIAEGRSLRPNEYGPPPSPSSPADCPFCEGNEIRTPPETAAVRRQGTPANGPGWSVRTIPNRFPTLAPDAVSGGPPSMPTLFEAQPGFGYHEVVIESPQHTPSFAFLPPEQALASVRMFRDRVGALATKPNIAAVLLFENCGPESGGTLMHPHAQLVATPLVPTVLGEETDGMQRFSRQRGGACLLESIAEEERKQVARVVLDDPAFLAVAPYASAYPYEVLLLPRRHAASITDASDAELSRLAEVLPALLRAQFSVQPSLSYNFFLHVAPNPMKAHPEFHWHIEIAPRVVRPDGFELGTGIFVNPVSPETAAEALRTALHAPTGPGER
jgi:UDPglucose--hexose-1-phosphate uridylyltransferase